ncbi:zinc metalloproteinase nas-15-like [Tubulanus polymorphus]|uniref:zinc metalloproteinase nas-15-like n=1 Tax=Tubulanus polymorphus TaxID=672921 RepID=UPI003DA648C8
MANLRAKHLISLMVVSLWVQVNGHPISDRLANPEELGEYFEGDIVFNSRNAILKESRLWNNGIVPYVLDSSISASQAKIFATAVAEYQKSTCIRWIIRTNQASYVRIFKGNGCYSYVGRLRESSSQKLSLSSGCWRLGTVIHEMMHAIGFYHEQSRYDRDDNVDVLFENIRDGKSRNFKKYSNTTIQHLDTRYDYGSIMHYSKYAFSKNGKPTMQPKDKSASIGQRRGFSQNDILKINRLYKCQ